MRDFLGFMLFVLVVGLIVAFPLPAIGLAVVFWLGSKS